MSNLYTNLSQNVKSGKKRVIWAFDPEIDSKIDPFSEFDSIFDEVHHLLTGVKFNRQLILRCGLRDEKFLEIIKEIKSKNLPVIMDAKVNDIGYTNETIANFYYEAGFDALICNPFVGFDGIKPIIKSANEFNKDVIFLVYMSHSSASFGYGRTIELETELEKSFFSSNYAKFYQLFANLVNYYDVAGGIVGATHIDKVKEVRNIFKDEKIIFSPGVGAQGGEYLKARQNGMDFAIIGRKITKNSERLSYLQSLVEPT